MTGPEISSSVHILRITYTFQILRRLKRDKSEDSDIKHDECFADVFVFSRLLSLLKSSCLNRLITVMSCYGSICGRVDFSPFYCLSSTSNDILP